MANEAMQAAWNGDEGSHWAAYADRYDEVSAPMHAAHVAAIPLGPSDDVLDIGCGAGELAIDLARRAADGNVLGVDLSSQLLEVAAKRAAAAGVTNVEFVRADAQAHQFPRAAFDLAVSSFGVMFFEDPLAAFTNIATALKPGGRFSAIVWRDLRENEWLMDIRAALAMGRDLPFPPAGAPSPFSLADKARTSALLAAAGLGEVSLEPIDAPMIFGELEDAYAFATQMGVVRGLTHDLDDDTARQALASLRQLLADRQTPRGVEMGAAGWIVTAARPQFAAR